MPELPLATTKQFRHAVRSAITKCGEVRSGWQLPFVGTKSYTDKTRNGKLRYVKLFCYIENKAKVIKEVEFILWVQGVTANTRFGSLGIRGTCVLEK